MSMGVGILTIPYFFTKVGLLGGVICLIIGAILSLLSFQFIFEAQKYSQKDSYIDIVGSLMPRSFTYFVKFTYQFDLFGIALIYSVFGYILFEYVSFQFGLLKLEYLKDP